MTEIRGQKSEISKAPALSIMVFGLCSLLLAPCSSAQAQQPKKPPLIGVLSGRGTPTPTTPDSNADAFRQGLRDLGYIEGKNILVEYRYSEGKRDRHAIQVAELMQLQVDVLVVSALPAIRAAKQATKTIPIVMVTTQDPVATGLIDNLARPGAPSVSGAITARPRTRRRRPSGSS